MKLIKVLGLLVIVIITFSLIGGVGLLPIIGIRYFGWPIDTLWFLIFTVILGKFLYEGAKIIFLILLTGLKE